MHRSILEARVIEVVEQILGGGRNEDDLVEIKTNWPDPKKFPRQLAGSANRSAGTDIIVVVGINEESHELAPPVTSDPEAWWPQVQSGFEGGVTPDLVNNLVIPIPSGGTVVALAFETDGAPYVVKNPEGKAPHFEVPMRTATGTNWAKRADLIRMLARRVRTPNVVALKSVLQFTWNKASERKDGASWSVESYDIFANLFLFVEHLGPEFVMLPHYGMKAAISIADRSYAMSVERPYEPRGAIRSRHGVEARHDGLLLTGPGQVNVRCRGNFDLEALYRIRAADTATVRLAMSVTGNDAPIRESFEFVRSSQPKDEGALQEDLGKFHYVRPESD